MKLTYEKLLTKIQEVSLIKDTPDDNVLYAAKRFLERAIRIHQKKVEKQNEYLQDIRFANAITGDKKEILYDEVDQVTPQGVQKQRIPKLSPEGMAKVNKDLLEFIEKQKIEEVEIKPYICSDDSWKRIDNHCILEELAGIVVPINWEEQLQIKEKE